MHTKEPRLDEIMTDNSLSIEDRMTYFLDEADLRHEGIHPMDTQLFYDCVSDIYVSAYRPIKNGEREMTREEQQLFTWLKNTATYLEDCLKNPDIGWMQPDAKGLRHFWETYSKIDYRRMRN